MKTSEIVILSVMAIALVGTTFAISSCSEEKTTTILNTKAEESSNTYNFIQNSNFTYNQNQITEYTPNSAFVGYWSNAYNAGTININGGITAIATGTIPSGYESHLYTWTNGTQGNQWIAGKTLYFTYNGTARHETIIRFYDSISEIPYENATYTIPAQNIDAEITQTIQITIPNNFINSVDGVQIYFKTNNLYERKINYVQLTKELTEYKAPNYYEKLENNKYFNWSIDTGYISPFFYHTISSKISITNITTTQTTNLPNLPITITINNGTKIFSQNNTLTIKDDYNNIYTITNCTELKFYAISNIAIISLYSNFINNYIPSVIPSGQEIIDIPGLMFQILSMPFTFISKAFDLTIFPNTPYEFNFANLFNGIIALAVLLFLIKLLTQGLNAIGNVDAKTTDTKWKKQQIAESKTRSSVNNSQTKLNEAKTQKINSSKK